MFKRILVPFDGSTGAAEALRKAAELKKLCGAELMTLTVYRHHSLLEASFSVQRPGDSGNLDDIMRGHAEEVAESGRALAKQAGVEDVRAFTRSGQPARTIIAFAKEHDVDLILLGSRGLGSVEGFLLGSVSHKVTALAECAVMVV